MPQLLSDVVRRRRAELGLNLIQVRDRGGPAPTLMVRIEREAAGDLTPAILAGLDAALEWTAGSAAGVLDGRDPVPRDEAEVQFVSSDVTISHEQLARLTAATLHIQAIADQSDDPKLSGAAKALHAAVSPLYGQFVTELLAANSHGVGSEALVKVIAPLLEREVKSADSGVSSLDEDEALRRWLAGPGPHAREDE